MLIKSFCSLLTLVVYFNLLPFILRYKNQTEIQKLIEDITKVVSNLENTDLITYRNVIDCFIIYQEETKK
jgi:hypothetical protein